jgi:hypothetical protein
MSIDENTNLPTRRPERQSIVLGNVKEIPLDGLSPETIEELKKEHAKGLIDVNTLANKYGIETHALASVLRNMAQETVNATKDNTAITMTRVQEDSLGKTEVIMGNTETAKKGKLTRSQAGLDDHTIAYIVGAVIIVVILALLLRH